MIILQLQHNFVAYSMSSLRFPVIQSKKSVEEEEYNFINKDKKKKTSTNFTNPIEIIEDLKRKIQQQKKEIDNRNITIQGLQRNFQSLSVIVKNQKANSAQLRSELDNLRNNADNGDKRAGQMHQKLILSQNQCKALKEELAKVKKTNSQYQQFVVLTDELKKRLAESEQTNEKLHSKIMSLDTQKKVLEIELGKVRVFEKDRRMLNERIIDLQQEIKKLTDQSNACMFKNGVLGEEVAVLKNELAKSQKKGQDIKQRYKQTEKRKSMLEADVEMLQRQNSRMRAQIQEKNKLSQNKQMYTKLKQQEQEKYKRELKALTRELTELKTSYEQLTKDTNQKTDMLHFAHKQISVLREENINNQQQWKKKEDRYLGEMEKLSLAIKDLHQKLNDATGQSSLLSKKLAQESSKTFGYKQKVSSLMDNIQEMNSQMQQHQNKYAHYLKLIAKNEPNVIITNEREMAKMENTSISTLTQFKSQIAEWQSKYDDLQRKMDQQVVNGDTMRGYIKNLQKEVETKSRQLIEKNRMLRNYEDQEDKLSQMIQEQRKMAERIKRESQEEIEKYSRELEETRIKSQKEIQEERTKREELGGVIQKYKKQEQDLKRMMVKEQQNMQRAAKEKQDEINRVIKQKETQIQKQRKNNKLLWTDNKKLKDMQLKLKEEAEKLLEEKQAAGRQEIQRLRREIERKYKEEMNALKSQDSNTSELKKILNEKANQMKLLSESNNKLKSQIQFYKNRNKQLQGVVSRIQKQYKDKMGELQRQNKASKQVIQVLDKKMKEAEGKVEQIEKKNKKEIKLLYDEIDDMKRKQQSMRIEEKLGLVGKSVSDLQTSLQALLNTLSCTYCVEVVKDCVRMDCGHIFCRKCKAGYQPNCGQCKKKGNPSNDKLIDETVTKGMYMRILLTTIKQDISKISL